MTKLLSLIGRIFNDSYFVWALISTGILILVPLYDAPNIPQLLKWTILIIYLLLNIWLEVIKVERIERTWKDKIINTQLRTAEQLTKILGAGKVRSNIFIKASDKYVIDNNYHFNMTGDNDLTIKIPIGGACTGEAWENGRQIFKSGNAIRPSGKFGVPATEMEKVSSNLYWICSTPIFRNHKVVRVLNFDGDKKISKSMILKIKKHCSSIRDVLNDCF